MIPPPGWRDLTSLRRTRQPTVRGALARPRVTALLAAARVGVVVAPAGYGKTTALTAFPGPLCWLTLDADDADPQVLAAGLALAAEPLAGGGAPAALLDAGAVPRLVAARVGDLLERTGATLVLDDAHHLTHPQSAELLSRLLGGPGQRTRLILLSRVPLALPELTRLDAAGEVARLSVAELAFTPQEVSALAAAQGLHLTPAEVRSAHTLTEGWPIALRFLVQAAVQGRVRLAALDDLHSDAQMGTLFTYLAQEVLGPLDPALRTLLTHSSVFEELTPDLLQSVLEERQAGQLLDALAGSGTFLTRTGEVYRAHPLLRAHLRAQLNPEEITRLAARGAAFFEATGRPRRALAAHLQAGHDTRAAELLARHGRDWLAQGRTHLVLRSVQAVPSAAWTPTLYALAGDALRASSRYAEALARYAQASPLDRALGEARVALDTVQPALAWEPLATAARLMDAAGQAGLQRLQAENLLNAGQLADALALDPELIGGARYCLRSGNLTAALRLATRAAQGETGGARAAQNHREGLLLLSFLQALLGQSTEAEARAREGLAEGVRLESPFVQSLALARLGHALLIQNDLTGAAQVYRDAFEMARGVAGRLQVEPLMGLTVIAARSGDAGSANVQLQDALERSSGDRYMAGLLMLSAGLGQLQGGFPEQAQARLDEARAVLAEIGDSFGQGAADLALYAAAPSPELAACARTAVLRYPSLLAACSLLSPFPQRAQRAVLLARLGEGASSDEALALGAVGRALGYPALPRPDQVPGFEVDVRVLGRLTVSRNGREQRDWGRAKARDLLMLLALHPDGLAREVAQDLLFPDADPPVAERNFRVILHALGQVLEEGAVSGTFLERGDWLRLRPSPDLRVDIHAAWAVLSRPVGSAGRLTELLALPLRVAEVALHVVQETAAQYVNRLSDALVAEAAAALGHGDSERAIQAAERALTLDPAHEPATRVLMRSLHLGGNPAAVARRYSALSTALANLGLSPLPETVALYRALTEL
ncbi:BTAD domain-containing putative transcriptional regulator [Deinococcus ruber]|uniref:Transcriptional activator n=1 Tax=Deinococcus ruber TaxID=1848197 RepID=A0A918CG94_9DEIO|nr:BTAD domain-containing putative transcriptional regulator [Deinococcus ruber]GGR19904.1 transcriptional activator [Deinococcus ruber]